MGKKKRSHPDLEEVLARPWCYYCERDFDDLKILIDHQRAKHFKCERCSRRLNTAGGLNVHMSQVHKEQLSLIENALPNRSGIEVEIFGMEGIPPDVTESHRNRVLTQFAQSAAERQAQTGNPAAGSGASVKKLKVETPEEMKARLAAHRAKKAAEAEAEAQAGETGGNAEQGQGQGQSQTATTGQAQDVQGPGYVPTPGNGYTPFQPPQMQQGQFPMQAQSPFGPPGMVQQSQFAPPGLPQMQSPYGQAPFGANGQFPSYQQPQFPTQGYTPQNIQSPFHAPSALPSRPTFASPAPPPQAPHSSSQPTPSQNLPSLPTDPPGPTPAPAPKKAKKDKENIKWIYGDNETSPEEKMARMPKYKFERDATIGETSLGDGGNMAMAGKDVVAHEGGFPNAEN